MIIKTFLSFVKHPDDSGRIKALEAERDRLREEVERVRHALYEEREAHASTQHGLDECLAHNVTLRAEVVLLEEKLARAQHKKLPQRTEPTTGTTEG